MSSFDYSHTIINPDPGTYLGTFGRPIDTASCKPLFNLKNLGISQGIQEYIQTRFEDNGKFLNFQKNELIDTLFAELKSIDDNDSNGNNKLGDACDVMKLVADPDNIEDLLTKYEKGPKDFFENIFGFILPSIKPKSLFVGDKVRMEGTKQEGFIIKVTTPTPMSSTSMSSTSMSSTSMSSTSMSSTSTNIVKTYDILIRNGILTQEEENAAKVANEALVSGHLVDYNNACNEFSDLLISGLAQTTNVVHMGQILKTNFRKIVRKTVRAIIEKPGPPQQCKNAFGKTFYAQNKFDKDNPMYCYICFKDLAARLDNTYHQRMECEHMFPITESQLVWGTYLNSFINKGGNVHIYNNHIANLKRLYAPVCQHCNGMSHKSNTRVLQYNNNVFEINIGLIPALVKSCAAPANHNYPKCRKYSGNNSTLRNSITITDKDSHIEYLKAVFQPLVDAVNKDVKFHLGKQIIADIDVKKIWNLFLCRYLFYLDDKALRDIKILLVGGQDIVEVQRKIDAENENLTKVFKKINDMVVKTVRVEEEIFKINIAKESFKNTSMRSKAIRVLKKLAKKIKDHMKEKRKKWKERKEKNKNIYKYFKKEIKNTSIISKRYFDRIYNFIISNNKQISPKISWLSHFGVNNDDISKLNIIADTMGNMKKNQGGGGKKLKFIQSGGGISQTDADDLLGGMLIFNGELQVNKASIYLVQLFEINSELNRDLKRVFEEDMEDLTGKNDAYDKEEKEQEEEDLMRSWHEIFGPDGLINKYVKKLQLHINTLKTNNENFYNICLNDIYKNINNKLDATRVEKVDQGEVKVEIEKPKTTPKQNQKMRPADPHYTDTMVVEKSKKKKGKQEQELATEKSATEKSATEKSPTIPLSQPTQENR